MGVWVGTDTLSEQWVGRLGGSTTPWECEWEQTLSQRSEWWLGGSTTLWECEWEHKFSQSSEWWLGGSTTPWKWEQTLSQNTSDVRSLSVVTQVRRMWECVWWHSMWDGECEKTSDGCEHSEKWGERERGDEWVSVRRVVWVSSQGWRWVWEHSVWEHSCEWVVVGVMWEQAGMSEHGSTSDGSESVRWLGLVRWVWVCVRTLSMGWVVTRVMWEWVVRDDLGEMTRERSQG